jgi:hypothetical protein
VERTGVGGDYDINSVRMEEENGNTVVIGSLNNGRVTFSRSITISKDLVRTFYIYVDISYQAQPENTIGFTLESRHDVMILKGSVHLKEVKPEQPYYNTGYILSIPDNIKIDGAFADWNGKLVENDTKDDTLRPEVDIQKYGVASTDYGAAFFLEVDQEISAGIRVPYWNRNTKPEPSIGGTTTGAAGEILPKTGEDIVYIFIDTIQGNGYQGNLPLTANYLIEITGRYNKVLSQNYYEWSMDGSGPGTWLQKGEVDVSLDNIRMEVGIEWISLGINPFLEYFDVFFWATDWERGDSDYSDGAPVRGQRGTRAQSLDELVAGVGISQNDRFGWNVSYAGDVNNDGYPDILVGAPYNDTSDGSKADAGAAYLFFGYPGIDSNNINAANANVTIYGSNSGDYFGWDVSDAKNVNGDSYDDIIIGAPGHDNDKGRAYIFYGKATGSWSSTLDADSDADTNITGENDYDRFGHSVSGAGNFDNSSNYGLFPCSC